MTSMPNVLDTIRIGVLSLAVVLPIVGGLVGLRILEGHPDRRRAIVAARGLALVVGIGGTLVIGQLAGMFGGGANYAIGLGWAVPIGILVFLSALGGYAALARPRVGAAALVGVLLGPIVLIGGPVGLGAWLGGVATEAAAAADRAAIAARSDGLHLDVSDVVATLRSDGTVGAVRLVATVTATRTYEVNVTTVDGAPTFFLRPQIETRGEGLYYTAPPGDDITFLPGTPTRFEMRLPAESFMAFQPGTWLLQMDFFGVDELEYRVEVPVEVRPGA
jgi:hypothetical protein